MGAAELYPLENQKEFYHRLQQETNELEKWFQQNRFETSSLDAGFELEFQLVDEAMQPAHDNLYFVKSFKKNFLVVECYDCLVEINSDFFDLTGRGLARIHNHLASLWKLCHEHAEQNHKRLLSIGMLPTFKPEHANKKFITNKSRYLYLDNNLRKMRHNAKIHFEINEPKSMVVEVDNISILGPMCATHIHFRLPKNPVAYYNASLIASAPLLAISTNSPYFYQHDLWDETRVALFEQTVNYANIPQRVTFEEDYLHESYFELFKKNLEYQPLIPTLNNTTSQQLWHLIFHNGTIWRWNRPVIGFDKHGKPHLRVENRVLPASSSIIDTVANVAFYIGLTHALAQKNENFVTKFPFFKVKQNFYAAAIHGIDCKLSWFEQSPTNVSDLLLKQLIPLATLGLQQLEFSNNDIKNYMDILIERVQKKLTPGIWQKNYILSHKNQFDDMLKKYYYLQSQDLPVGSWRSD